MKEKVIKRGRPRKVAPVPKVEKGGLEAKVNSVPAEQSVLKELQYTNSLLSEIKELLDNIWKERRP